MDNLRQKLGKYNLTLKKKFGQNFLTDDVLLNSIVEKAGVNKETSVLEIGCGAGALTKVLAKYAKKVIGYEIDKDLKPLLTENLDGQENVEIVYKDVMKEDILEIEKKTGENYLLVANLPYYITTPIVMRFLETSKNISGLVIMVQEEVAERFCAEPKTSDYGAITVGINLRGNAKIIERVGREKFTPVPNVDSAVVKIDIDKEKFINEDLKKVRNVVRVAFSSRRKTLVNNLIIGYKIDRTKAEEIVTKLGFSLTVRGEELSVHDFVALSKMVRNGKNSSCNE